LPSSAEKSIENNPARAAMSALRVGANAFSNRVLHDMECAGITPLSLGDGALAVLQSARARLLMLFLFRVSSGSFFSRVDSRERGGD